MKKILFLFIIVMFLVFFTLLVVSIFSFSKKYPASETTSFQIATSFYPLYFITREIVGDMAEVYTITPAGVEPHDFEPTTRDIVRINDSDLLIILGGGFEPWAESFEDALVVSDGLVFESDPHLWLSPRQAEEIVARITNAIIEKDPAYESVYRSRSAALLARLRQLDTAYRTGLSQCKETHFITSHAAFGYLAREYGLTQVEIAGLSPDEEPSHEDVATIVNLARERKITTIFFESLVSPELAETIATEIGARTQVLNPIEGLTPADIAQGKDYFTEMEQNLVQLRTALTCQ